ncbi:MAG: archaeal proteasome endopeptidase complex subunit beta [Candidatus Aenigmarchaeota archaeon]|nr:archaeal proteasome endopeptidase complex subunit beta [Candidatus Aenigmarchaeota archaeon]MDW8149219.1 archaeal proteasome endopeptidase complex subunit beta [Candidatus Aenigmarchaeota archaeon]
MFNTKNIKKSGTTTVGIICKDGVVLGSEKKSVMGYLIASKEAKKIFPVADRIAVTVAGVWGDGIALVRYLKAEIKLYEMENKMNISVKGAASLLSNILYSGRWTFLPYMVELIVAGYDDKPAIFTIDAIGGLEEEKKFFSTGSGSPIALGVLEDSYSDDITVEKAKEIAVRAIKSAIERDIGSGGKAIDLCLITKDNLYIESLKL